MTLLRMIQGPLWKKAMLLPGTHEDHMNCPMLLPTPEIVREPQSLQMINTFLPVKLSRRQEESTQTHGVGGVFINSSVAVDLHMVLRRQIKWYFKLCLQDCKINMKLRIIYSQGMSHTANENLNISKAHKLFLLSFKKFSLWQN